MLYHDVDRIQGRRLLEVEMVVAALSRKNQPSAGLVENRKTRVGG